MDKYVLLPDSGSIKWNINASQSGRYDLTFTYRSPGRDNAQKRIMNNFPTKIRAHVYHGNHHFHGSIDQNYLVKMDPYLFLVSAQQAVYDRCAYATKFKRNVEQPLKTLNGRMIEDLMTREVGHIVVRINDAENWSYETYKNL